MSYTVTYDAGPCTGDVPTQGPLSSGDTFTVQGFSGLIPPGGTMITWWAEDPNDINTLYSPGSVYTMSDHDVTLYALLGEAQAHTITYDAHGGVGDVPTQDLLFSGDTFVVADGSTLTPPDGTIFGGWMDGGAEILYQPNDTYTVGDSDVTLTAQWAALYTITYAANGGAGEVPTQAALQTGAKCRVAQNTLTRAGYRFTGWKFGANIYQPGTQFTVVANVTLTAQWAKLYTITYAANGGAGKVPTQAALLTGATFRVARNTLTKSKSTFVGWNDGKKKYMPNDSYTVVTSNVTLTAQWKKTGITPSSLWLLFRRNHTQDWAD